MSKLTTEQLSRLKPPDGWEFLKTPTLKTVGSIRRVGDFNRTNAPVVLRELFAWCKKHRLGLKGTHNRALSDPGGYRRTVNYWSAFNVQSNVSLSHTKAQFEFSATKCADCARTYAETGTADLDPACARCGYPTNCRACGSVGFPPAGVFSAKGRLLAHGCASCLNVCISVKCTNLCTAGQKKCPECDPQEQCTSCAQLCSIAEMKKVAEATEATPSRRARSERFACKDCYERNSCTDCGAYAPRGLAVYEGKKICSLCVDKRYDRDRERHEKWESHELPIHGKLTVPSLPERPFRTISIETEMDGDGPYLARTLYRCGLVEYPQVLSYGSHPSRGMKFPAFLKHDGSVTAGELITFLIDLDDPTHAKALLEILSKVRGLRELGKLQFNPNCGGHIHIDAHNFTFSDTWRLTTVWNFLEDPIYRLAGAGAPYGHRTLDANHDRANHGGGYASPVSKGPFGTQSAFGLKIEQQGRMCGLNFQHYVQARHNCLCGDMNYGEGRDCTCNLGKSTIEWRVWNSTSNPRIMHAWIAFMQAMHSYAQRDTKMTSTEEKRYTALPWEIRKFEKLSEAEVSTWKERVEWMHANLPLLPEERDSIVYAYKQSDVAERLGNIYLDGLLNIPNKHDLVAKQVRNPNRRERKISIKIPSPTDNVGEVDEGPLAAQAVRRGIDPDAGRW